MASFPDVFAEPLDLINLDKWCCMEMYVKYDGKMLFTEHYVRILAHLVMS